jgi:hypothetical protein
LRHRQAFYLHDAPGWALNDEKGDAPIVAQATAQIIDSESYFLTPAVIHGSLLDDN